MKNEQANELERMWKEAVVAYSLVLSQHLYEVTEENYNKTSTRIAGLRAQI
jgi:hypothetical protein